MKRVQAQFRARRRPTRGVLAGLLLLTACAVAAVAGTIWEHHRVAELQAQVSRWVEAGREGAIPPPPRRAPSYDASARQFMRERGAAWAPMLRTLESGAIIGVTPKSVEFGALDGVARVELSYGDSAQLVDYLGRINEGDAPEAGMMRWTLVQTSAQPGGMQAPTATLGGAPSVGSQSAATIRSTWRNASDAKAVVP